MTLPRLSSLLLLCLLLTICIVPAAASSPYADLLQDPSRSTEDKLADFADALGWRDELGTYQMEMENYEMQVAQQQAEIQQAQELQEAAAALGLDISSTVESALESIATTAPPYTAEELAALDAESAAYYEAFAANYVATAAFSGSGSGTQGDPYIITNRAELEAMADDLTAYYQLGNDIDLGGSSSPWTPIGSLSAPFSGTLDGDGYAISNLYLDITDRYFGLFSAIAGSTVSHVLISATATNEGVNFGDFGAIAGSVVYTNAPTSFVQCTISIDFSGTPVQNCFVGGIYGSLSSSYPSASLVQISDCVVDIQISVDTTSALPSISAFGPIGTIYRSYATGSIQYLSDTGLAYQRGIGGISSGSRAGWVSVDSVVSLLTDIDAGVADAYRIVPVGSIVDAYANAAMLVNGWDGAPAPNGDSLYFPANGKWKIRAEGFKQRHQ